MSNPAWKSETKETVVQIPFEEYKKLICDSAILEEYRKIEDFKKLLECRSCKFYSPIATGCRRGGCNEME